MHAVHGVSAQKSGATGTIGNIETSRMAALVANPRALSGEYRFFTSLSNSSVDCQHFVAAIRDGVDAL
jgi:hypothetical protein